MAAKSKKKTLAQPVSYAAPPVSEVYISLQTSKKVFPAGDFGLLLGVFGSQFTKLTAHPRIDRMDEAAPDSQPTVRFEMLTDLGQRFWLVSEDDSRVFQVQDDRVVYNWRRRPGGEYPRYRTIRGEFEKALAKLLGKLEVGTDDLVDFCEVSYTNQISIPGVDDPRPMLHRVFKHFKEVDLGLENLPLEETGFAWAFQIRDPQSDAFLGRMRIATNPAILRPEKRFILQTVLTFRGKPAGSSLNSALEFCDRGRIAIVSAFDRITTEEMHAAWGKE